MPYTTPKIPQKRLHLPAFAQNSLNNLPLNKLCDFADWQDDSFRLLAAQILGTDGSAPYHRKLWEFTQLVRALKENGLLSLDYLGLSVGAGFERVLYYLANQCGRIIASDLYGDSAFAAGEASRSVLEDPARHAPYPYRQEALSAVYMNGCALGFPDSSFDFAFCLSSLEHFGGLENAAVCVREMARVVRPGGIVFFTTECSLNGFVTDEVFKPAEIEYLLTGSSLTLCEPFNWSLSGETLNYLIDMRKDDLSSLPHINLKLFASIFTSISVAARKEGNQPRCLNIEALDSLVEKFRSIPTQRDAVNRKTLSQRAIKKLLVLKWRTEDLLCSLLA